MHSGADVVGLSSFLEDATHQMRLALPIMGAQLAQTGMALVDTLMTGNYAAADLAAVSIGSSLWLPLYLLIVGVLMAVTPTVARAHGAGRIRHLGRYAQGAIWLSLLLGAAGAIVLLQSRAVFDALGMDVEVGRRGAAYLAAVAAGFPAIAVYQVLRGICEGVHQVRPVLLIGFVGLLVNVPANYVLIYGALGFPAMGATGCGIATAVSMWAMVAVMAAYVARTAVFARLGLLRRLYRIDAAAVADILRVGVPIGLSIFFEVSLFAAIALLVAGLGTTVVAAHQIALNYTSLLFMIPLSLGMALTVRVGHGLGSGGQAVAARRSWNGIVLSAGVGVVLSVIMVITARVVVGFYTPDAHIRELAASLVLLAALYQVSDTLQVNAAGALRGYRDTRVIMLITLPAYWVVGLGVGLWLSDSGLPPGPLGVHGYWYGLLAGLSTASVLLLWRLRRLTLAASRATT